MITPVEIINGTMNVTVDQIQDSTFSIIASISALIVALFAIIGYITTNSNTKKSIELYDLDIKTRLRAWVFPTYFGPTYASLPTMGMDYQVWALNPDKYTEKPTSVRFGVRMKNNGLLPAKNFQFKTLEISDKEITKEQIQNKKYDSSIRDIFPTEEFDIDMDMKTEKFEELERNELWVSTMAKYEIDGEREQIIGFIGYLSKGSGRRRATWSAEIIKEPKKKSRGRR